MFDKTGTITKGTLEVAKIWLQGDSLSPAVILAAVGSAESNSEHPIAAAIIKYVRSALGTELVGKSTNFQVNLITLLPIKSFTEYCYSAVFKYSIYLVFTVSVTNGNYLVTLCTFHLILNIQFNFLYSFYRPYLVVV